MSTQLAFAPIGDEVDPSDRGIGAIESALELYGLDLEHDRAAEQDAAAVQPLQGALEYARSSQHVCTFEVDLWRGA